MKEERKWSYKYFKQEGHVTKYCIREIKHFIYKEREHIARGCNRRGRKGEEMVKGREIERVLWAKQDNGEN